MLVDISKQYFNWMYNQVCSNKDNTSSYFSLFECLHSIPFTYSIPMDGNRASDGIDLRYRFGYDNHIDDALISYYLDNQPCTVLEMMVALSMRCEETIMDNPNMGNRMPQWFWGMINNLGLDFMDDAEFDEDYVRHTIDIFLNREYSRNGKGGLFTVRHTNRDLRNVEIWYQLNWYLNETIQMRGEFNES